MALHANMIAKIVVKLLRKSRRLHVSGRIASKAPANEADKCSVVCILGYKVPSGRRLKSMEVVDIARRMRPALSSCRPFLWRLISPR